MSLIEAASKKVDQKSVNWMRGLRESVIAAGFSLVPMYRAVQSNDWAGFGWSIVIGAIGFGWTGLGLVRMRREARSGAREPHVVPPSVPFSDDPSLRARVEAGRADLEDLRSQLTAIETAKRSRPSGRDEGRN